MSMKVKRPNPCATAAASIAVKKVVSTTRRGKGDVESEGRTAAPYGCSRSPH